jgi:pyridoxal phosphate enzyme (YggS family)
MSITENVAAIRARIEAAAIESGRTGAQITLVAATKMNDASRVREAVAAGVDVCGENRVQELLEKNEQHAYDGAPLHFIGHLQTNKVKYLVGLVDLIQSVDSEALLREIEKRASKLDLTQDVLIEVNIGGEEAKSGVAPSELERLLYDLCPLSGIHVQGLMTVPPILQKEHEKREIFSKMYQLFVDNRAKKLDNIDMLELSMGMSGDYVEAIKEGSTIVRVGSAIFGARHY